MRKVPLLSLVAAAAATASVLSLPIARAEVIYSGLQNIAVPTDFNGVYLNLDTGATTTSEPADFPSGTAAWDINPFFGGAGVATSPTFLPARTGSGNDDPIMALGSGVLVNSSLLFPGGYDGYGGSGSHLGAVSGQFQPGQEAYLGFKFTSDSSAGPFNGWMRVVFTANAPGGVIKDWAYETASGVSITTGNILRSAPSDGVSAVTLSGATGQSATLGSIMADPGNGTLTGLAKSGAGTWIVNSDQPYTGATVISSGGGTLEIGGTTGKLSGTSSITVNNGGTLLLSGDGGTNSKLNPSAAVTLAGGELSLAGLSSSVDQTVGALTLTVASVLDFSTLEAGHTWRFGASNADWSGLELNVWNYTPGVDRLFFGTSSSALDAAQLGRINFFSGNGTGALGSTNFSDSGQLVPVPEPSTVFAALTLVGVIGWRERGKLRRFVRGEANQCSRI